MKLFSETYLIRQLALTFAMKFTGSWMINKFKELEASDKVSFLTNSLNYVQGLKNVDILPEIAATSGGLKALCTYLSWSGKISLNRYQI